MIEGGYILQPRIIKESQIMKQPPHYREIWFYLLREANHKKNHVCDRGELIRSYKDILEDLSWYVGYRKESYKKHHCEKAMKWLTKERMIATRRTTRGVRIKILQYDKYQTPENYERDYESDNKATTKRRSSSTINKNEKNVKNDNKEYISKFEEFWNMYPVKTGKKKAKEKYKKLYKKHLEIMEGLKKYIIYIKWLEKKKETDPKVFIPAFKHPTTYLNGEYWNDEYIAEFRSEMKKVQRQKETKKLEEIHKKRRASEAVFYQFRADYLNNRFGADKWSFSEIIKDMGLIEEISKEFKKQCPEDYKILNDNA